MSIATKGIMRKGKIEPLEILPVQEGDEVWIIALPGNTQVDLNTLFIRQETLKKIWEEDEDLYGKVQ